jgi:hypothetical protein
MHTRLLKDYFRLARNPTRIANCVGRQNTTRLFASYLGFVFAVLRGPVFFLAHSEGQFSAKSAPEKEDFAVKQKRFDVNGLWRFEAG